jgi:hypothetical protein
MKNTTFASWQFTGGKARDNQRKQGRAAEQDLFRGLPHHRAADSESRTRAPRHQLQREVPPKAKQTNYKHTTQQTTPFFHLFFFFLVFSYGLMTPTTPTGVRSSNAKCDSPCGRVVP